MSPSYRGLRRLLPFLSALGLFLLISANPLAQSTKLPPPSSHVSDLAGVIDAQTKSRLENLLQNLKEKSKIELYVATVDSTGAQESRLSRNSSRVIGISERKRVATRASCSWFPQLQRLRLRSSAGLRKLALPDGVLGEMTYRMRRTLE